MNIRGDVDPESRVIVVPQVRHCPLSGAAPFVEFSANSGVVPDGWEPSALACFVLSGGIRRPKNARVTFRIARATDDGRPISSAEDVHAYVPG
jgi:hypothetical protein